MESDELANRAIKNLNGQATDKAIRKAVLNACLESQDLVPQQTIEEAVARIKRGVSVAERVKVYRSDTLKRNVTIPEN